MLNNESILWDKKYSNKSDHENMEDFFYFAKNNPTIKEINKILFDGAKVLEIGSGTGELICYLSVIKNIEPYGIDFSKEAIFVSNKLSSRFNFSVSFINASINKLPFENDYFDIIYGDQVVGHLSDVNSSMAEIYRILKPGGCCFLSTANKLRPDGWDLYKIISDKHLGYTQNSFYPWTLKNIVNLNHFKYVKGYGDMFFLFRNTDIIKKILHRLLGFKRTTQESKKINKSFKQQNNPSFLKKSYNKIDSLTPWWFKISIGVVFKK